MVSVKKRKQKLKAPDEFQKKAFVFADWCAANQVQIVIGLSAIFIGVAANLSWKFYQNEQGEKRREEIAVIDRAFNKELEAVATQTQSLQTELTAIDNQIKELATSNADTPESSQLADKKAEIQKRIENIKPKHDETAEKYLTFYRKYNKTPEGLRAGLAALNTMIQKESFKEATDLAKDVLTNADAELSFYQFQVRLVYVSLLEEQGLYNEALEETEKLKGHASEEEMPKVLMAKARLEILAQKKAEAQSTLEQLINEHNSSPEAQKAKAMKYLW